MCPQDQKRNDTLAGCPCRRSGTIAINHNVKNDTIVMRISVVAVPVPVVRGPVNFNITAIETAVDLNAGAGEIRAAVFIRSTRRENPDGQTI
jgi:hypothetical protein